MGSLRDRRHHHEHEDDDKAFSITLCAAVATATNESDGLRPLQPNCLEHANYARVATCKHIYLLA
jgi:hypothetical protein